MEVTGNRNINLFPHLLFASLLGGGRELEASTEKLLFEASLRHIMMAAESEFGYKLTKEDSWVLFIWS